MSPQIEFLKNLTASAQTGDEAAIRLLRKVCAEAVKKATPYALVAVAQCFCHLGVEATSAEIGRN